MNKNTSISLGSHFEEFISGEVKFGRYGSVSDLICSASRILKSNQIKERQHL